MISNNAGSSFRPSDNNARKQKAAEKFSEYGNQIRELVAERQQLNIKIEVANKEKVRMEDGDQGLESILTSQDPALEFLSLDTDWDPKKVRSQMEGFLTLIENHKHRFQRAPIGPLFFEVAIKNSAWCKLIEKILSKYLCTFVVDNAEDEIILEGLAAVFRGPLNRLEEFGENPLEIHIFVVKFSNKFEPLPRPRVMNKMTFVCANLLDTLKYKEEEQSDTWKYVVGRLLNAESIYLFLTEHDAFVFMYAQSSMMHRKFLAYSLDGYRIFPFPEFKTAAIKIPKQMSFFTVDRSEDIAFLKATANELEDRRKMYDTAINNLRELQFAALYEWEEKEDDPNNNDVNNNENYENSKKIVQIQTAYETKFEKCKSTAL